MRMIINTEDSGRSLQRILAVGGALCAVGAGCVAATGVPRNAAFLVGMIVTPLLVAAPLAPFLALTFVTGFFLSGMVEFFLRFQQMHWAVAYLFAVLLLRVPFLLPTRQGSGSPWFKAILVMLTGYCFALILSIAVNLPTVLQTIAGLKHYLLPLGLLGVVACTELPQFWISVWRFIPWVMIVQFPVAVLQHIFYVRTITDAMGSRVTWDAVVGTFGGDPNGGGASGALALFLCVGVVATAAQLREKLISRRLAQSAWLAALGVMLLAEVKVVVIILPLALLLYHRRALMRSPLRAIGWIITTIIFAVVLLGTYSFIHYSSAGKDIRSPSAVLEYIANYEGSVEAGNAFTGEVSRVGAISLWWRYNVDAGKVRETIFGHGPAASKYSATFGYGEAAKLHRFNLNTSSLSALLWDLGLLGAWFFLGLLLASALAAFSTAARVLGEDKARYAILETCGIAALLLMVTSAYNVDAIETAPIQMLLAVVIGLTLNPSKTSWMPVNSVSAGLANQPVFFKDERPIMPR